MLNMWREEGEIPADLQDESERMSLEVATAASEILDVLDNSTTDFSFRSGIRGAMKGEDQRGSVESGIRTIFAPLLGTKKKWSNVDFVGKTVTSGRELAGVAMVARDPRIEHNHLYYVKKWETYSARVLDKCVAVKCKCVAINTRHLKNKTEEQIRDVISTKRKRRQVGSNQERQNLVLILFTCRTTIPQATLNRVVQM